MTTNVERELGVIVTKLDQLEKDNQEAREHRKWVAETLEQQLKHIERLQNDMEVVKPITDKLSKWQLVGTGVILTVGAIGTAVGISFATIKEAIARILWGS